MQNKIFAVSVQLVSTIAPTVQVSVKHVDQENPILLQALPIVFLIPISSLSISEIFFFFKKYFLIYF